MSVSMYNTLSKFTQSLLADNVVITFPGYTKSYQPKWKYWALWENLKDEKQVKNTA